MEKAEAVQKLTITYKRAQDYRRISATGAFGGLTPNGHVMCELYVEASDYPGPFTFEIRDDGTGQEVDKPEVKGCIRELQMGVVFRPDVALSVGKFLVNQAEAVLAQAKKMAEE